MNPNTERDERVRQLTKERDEWKEFAEECKEGIRASHRVLDELGVPREDAWLQETDGENYGIEEVVEYPVHERIKMLPPFAATRMRDRCVEKVKSVAKAHREMGEKFKGKAIGEMQLIRAEECDILARSLESLTLEQGEQEKR